MITSIIVNFNSVRFVRRLLASGGLSGTEVVIVDNGSEPEEVTDLCSAFAATPILLPVNVGFAAGVNVGIRALGPDTSEVLLVNPDVTIAASAVSALHQALSTLGADAVTPLVLNEGATDVGNGAIGGGALSLWALAAYYWFLARVFHRVRGLYLNRPQTRRLSAPIQLDWLTMTCMLVRRDSLLRYGLLPEDEFMYFEDVAWGTQASDQGARLCVVPSVTVEHLGGGSGGSSYEASLAPLCRLIRRRMSPVRAGVGCFIVWTGLRLRLLAGLPVASPRSASTAMSDTLPS